MRQPGPRRRLNPKLIRAVRSWREPQYLIAQSCGFRYPVELSRLVNSTHVLPTERNVTLLNLVAAHIGFSGKVLLEAYQPPRRDSFDSESLPNPEAP